VTENKILDLLERAFEAGCFPEVLKMIRAKTSEVVIEQVIEKSKKRQENFELDWEGLFGSD